ADPTYPFLPVSSIVGAALLLLVLTVNFVRQSYNLGVSFLCFWLFWELSATGINTILWSDNADLKLYVYCDIVSHLFMITYAAKPACTLLISRRLYKVVSSRSVLLPSRKEVISSDYIVQDARFLVEEGFGCIDTAKSSWLTMILIYSWPIIFSSISVLFYCPKVVYVFYRRSRDIDHFFQSSSSVSRPNYLRLLVLASLDIILTLPIAIASFVDQLSSPSPGYSIPLYTGWKLTHSDWTPISLSYSDLETDDGRGWTFTVYYLNHWSSVVLALVIFSLFGLTADARTTYRRAFY
ncbi:GPCR fungal pheromone mating factor, partial [Vararia minispora EC-137]